MGTKRVGWARIKSLVNENQNALHPVLSKAAGAAGEQDATKIIIGKNGDATGTTADPYTESATALYDLGTTLIDGDRVYRYCGAGGTGIAAGKAVQHRALHHANHRDLTCAAAAVGATAITVTLGATAATADQYAGGYIAINDGPGEGQLFKIKSNPAADASATLVLTLFDKVVTALTTSSKADLITDVWDDLIIAPAAEDGAVVGVTPIALTADYYGWVQTHGPCAVLQAGVVVLGNNAVRSATVAGAVAPATSDILTHIGEVMVVNGDGEHCVVWLRIN